MLNKLSKVFILLLTVILLSAICITPQTVFAENASAEAQAVIDLIAKLPTDTKTVTIDHKDDIVAAKVAYDALTPDQKLEISSDNLVKLNGNYSAAMPFVLQNLVTKVKKLPDVEKIGEDKKDEIVSLYTDYGVLDETAKGAFAKAHREKLLLAVSKLAPDKLSEEDKEAVAKLSEQTETKSDKNKEKISFSTIWQMSIIIFVSIIVLCGLAAMIVLLIKVFRLQG
ncbi:MAG: hypothetical protein J6J39_05500 [Clostridia bacterium]|nr:hypothetical protein [Clostridia bacterium]